MAKQQTIATPQAASAPAPAQQQTKRRKKRSGRGNAAPQTFVGGWNKVNLEDIEIEGFEDGCAFELEEMTDYQLEKTELGGHILIGSERTTVDTSKKKKKRKTSKAKKDAADGDAVDGDAASDNDSDDEDAAPPVIEQQPKKAKLTSNKDTSLPKTDTQQPKKDKQNPQKDKDQPKKDKQQPKKDTLQSKKDKLAATRAAPATPLTPIDLPGWSKYKLHNTLLHALKQQNFLTPTRIQAQTIFPALIDNRDVVGAAPTGSGKTLAFGLPILSQLLHAREQSGYQKECKALILTPTRELALQIHQHLEAMVPHREVGIVTLVGGMAVQKQKRLLTYKPEIVIGTPGRLWDLMDQHDAHFQDLRRSLRFLVVDEADRMLQTGSYPEVEKIFDALRGAKGTAADLADVSDEEDDDDDEVDDDNDADDESKATRASGSAFANGAKVMMFDDVLKLQAKQQQQQAKDDNSSDTASTQQAVAVVEPPRLVRQTFLFSATLTIPEGGRFQTGKKKHVHALTVLESVMKRVGLRGKPAVVDLSIDERSDATAADLTSADTEARRKQQAANVALSLPTGLELCEHAVSDATRDSFLYYFLTQYPGRTIVFLNAIHQVRRVASLLTLLHLPVFALHAEMQQRQRLKKLDSFRAHAKGILVATDVAARGLDIPSVDYVVHYHIARSTEVFVHRSGRTARANKEGLSISLVGPQDAKYHAQICKMLQRPTGLSEFPFDHRFLPAIDERVRLAKDIGDDENASGKVKSEETWFSQMAAAADLDMDDNLVMELKSKSDAKKSSAKKGAQSIDAQRAQLSRLLAEPLRPVGSMRKFRQLYQELGAEISTDGEYRKRNASEDLEAKSKKSFKRFRKRK